SSTCTCKGSAMKLRKLKIENFRGLSSIDCEFDKPTNIFVGPNAIGKTTVLEAIRLAKTLLMPRYFQEGQQVLVSLGAVSQHPLISASWIGGQGEQSWFQAPALHPG